MGKRKNLASIDINLNFSASSMQQLFDALDTYDLDIFELDAYVPSSRIRSAVASATAKLRAMSFTDEGQEKFPLSELETIAAATAVHYILWLYEADLIKAEDLPDSLQDKDTLSKLDHYLVEKMGLVGVTLPESF